MKIRIKGNALRYRLTRSDITTLSEKGEVLEQTVFAGQTLIYALKTTTHSDLSADFIGNIITLFMPESMIDEITHTDKVGFSNAHGQLFLLVEKDFTCLDNVEEDQSDNYPNPLASKTLNQ